MNIQRKYIRLYKPLTFAILICALIGACGGGSSGGGAGDSVTPALSATITFPGETALLTEGHVTVRGTASHESAVSHVLVNGVQATSSDGFATWEVTLDLPAGVNTLTVSTEDVKGNKTNQAATAMVTVGPWFQPGSGRRVALEANGKILVTDGAYRTSRLLRVDPLSGVRTIVSSATSGELRFSGFNAIAVEKTGQIVVTDCGRVLRVDPSTGVRTIVSDATTGSGPILNCVSDVALEPSGKLIVLDWAGEPWSLASRIMRVVRIDPLSGDRNIVSDISNGIGPDLTATSIAVELTGQLVVTNVGAFGSDVVRVDPVTGARTIFSAAPVDGGPTTIIDTRIGVQPSGQLIVAESYWDRPSRVIRVDPHSGVRTIISDASIGSGTSLWGNDPIDIAIEATGQLLVSRSEGITWIDPTSGARSIASQVSIGAGSAFVNLTSLVVVEQAGQIVVVDTTGTIPNRIVRVDTRSGARTIVSDEATGGGPPFGIIASVAIERAGGIVVLDKVSSGARIVRVDPRNGVRSIVAEGLSVLLNTIAVDAAGRFVMAGGVTGSGDLILRVDPQGGARTIIAFTPPPDLSGVQGPIHGLGLPTINAIAIASNGQIVVTGQYGVERVDPVSGVRTTVTYDGGSGIAIDPLGNIFLVGNSIVSRLDPATGLSTMVVNFDADFGLDFIRGIAIEASGQLVVTSSRQAVLRIDPRNGALAMISR